MKIFTKYIIALFVLLSSTSRAQIDYGIKGGLNIADIVLTNYIDQLAEADYKLKIGLHAGIYASVDLENRFVLSGEALYSNKGVKANTNVHLHYITLPLLAQYKITESFLIELGPELGYLFSAKSKFGNLSNVYNNKLDIGLGAGLKYKINDSVFLGMRYSAGFSSVINSNERSNIGSPNDPPENIKYQNRVLQLSVGYRLGKKEI